MGSRVCFLRMEFFGFSFENRIGRARASIIEKRYDGSSLVVFGFFFRTIIDGLIWTERREWLFVSSWREWRIEIVRNLIRKKHKNCIVRVKISRLLRSKRSMEVRMLLVFPKNITSLRVTSNMSKMKKTCSGLIRHKGRERKSKNNRERVTTKNVAVTVQMTENVIYSFMLFRLNLNIIILLYFFWYICDMKYFLNIIGNIYKILRLKSVSLQKYHQGLKIYLSIIWKKRIFALPPTILEIILNYQNKI